jgi:hypothetical protein
MIEKRWPGAKCIVAATGPSLTPEVAERVNAAAATHKIIAVNDAYKLLPFADLLYGMDSQWWNVHNGAPGFAGEKWTAREVSPHRIAEKEAAVNKYGLHCVDADWALEAGFSFDPARIHYGANSGFQAINLAILFGVTEVILVGFDMRNVNGQPHFFGLHPRPLNNPHQYPTFIENFTAAARALPAWLRIINATPNSALTCFPMQPLEACL